MGATNSSELLGSVVCHYRRLSAPQMEAGYFMSASSTAFDGF
jgi:hypothetical protein